MCANFHLTSGCSVYFHPRGQLWFDGYNQVVVPVGPTDFQSLVSGSLDGSNDPMRTANLRYHNNLLFENGWLVLEQNTDPTPDEFSRVHVENSVVEIDKFLNENSVIDDKELVYFCGYLHPILLCNEGGEKRLDVRLSSLSTMNVGNLKPIATRTSAEIVERNLERLPTLVSRLTHENQADRSVRIITSTGTDSDVITRVFPSPDAVKTAPSNKLQTLSDFGGETHLSLEGNGYGFEKNNAKRQYLESLVHPLWGHVRGVHKHETGVRSLDENTIHNYFSDHSFTNEFIGLSRKASIHISAGKGSTRDDAFSSAVGESIERISGLLGDRQPDKIATLCELGDSALPPNEIALYSDNQFRDRDIINLRGNPYEFVPERIPDDELLHWCKIDSLVDSSEKYALLSQCYYSNDKDNGGKYTIADSNGCAAGWTFNEAALQAIFELIERDAVAIWWYNKAKASRLSPHQYTDRYTMRCFRELEALGREAWLLNITTDIGVPCYVALSANSGGEIAIGFGCHLDPNVAMRRAALEMAQFLPLITDKGYRLSTNREAKVWFNSRKLEPGDFLNGTEDHARIYEEYATKQLTGREAVQLLVSKLAKRSIHCYALDQTLPGCKLHVVRIIAPGLRHFWRRLAPGRLYEVSKQDGAEIDTFREEKMNHETVFF